MRMECLRIILRYVETKPPVCRGLCAYIMLYSNQWHASRGKPWNQYRNSCRTRGIFDKLGGMNPEFPSQRSVFEDGFNQML